MGRNRALGSPFEIDTISASVTTEARIDMYAVDAALGSPVVVTLDPNAFNGDQVWPYPLPARSRTARCCELVGRVRVLPERVTTITRGGASPQGASPFTNYSLTGSAATMCILRTWTAGLLGASITSFVQGALPIVATNLGLQGAVQ